MEINFIKFMYELRFKDLMKEHRTFESNLNSCKKKALRSSDSNGGQTNDPTIPLLPTEQLSQLGAGQYVSS